MNASSLLSLFIGLLIFTSCSKPQEPEFRKFSEVKLVKKGRLVYELSGSAVYYNPNGLGGVLQSVDLSVALNDALITRIDTTLDIEIAADAEFIIPVKTLLNLKSGSLNKDLLSKLLPSLFSGEVDMHYYGNAKIRLAGIPFTIPLDFEEKVKLSK